MTVGIDDVAKTVAQLAAEIVKLQAEYEVAKIATQSARMRETDALNALNEKQKAFDAAVSSLRGKSAGDWSHKQVGVPAGQDFGGYQGGARVQDDERLSGDGWRR